MEKDYSIENENKPDTADVAVDDGENMSETKEGTLNPKEEKLHVVEKLIIQEAQSDDACSPTEVSNQEGNLLSPRRQPGDGEHQMETPATLQNSGTADKEEAIEEDDGTRTNSCHLFKKIILGLICILFGKRLVGGGVGGVLGLFALNVKHVHVNAFLP